MGDICDRADESCGAVEGMRASLWSPSKGEPACGAAAVLVRREAGLMHRR